MKIFLAWVESLLFLDFLAGASAVFCLLLHFISPKGFFSLFLPEFANEDIGNISLLVEEGVLGLLWILKDKKNNEQAFLQETITAELLGGMGGRRGATLKFCPQIFSYSLVLTFLD